MPEKAMRMGHKGSGKRGGFCSQVSLKELPPQEDSKRQHLLREDSVRHTLVQKSVQQSKYWRRSKALSWEFCLSCNSSCHRETDEQPLHERIKVSSSRANTVAGLPTPAQGPPWCSLLHLISGTRSTTHGLLPVIISVSLTHLSRHRLFRLDFQPKASANGSSDPPPSKWPTPHSVIQALRHGVLYPLLILEGYPHFFSRLISPSLFPGKTESSAEKLVSAYLLISRYHNQE